MSEHEKFHNFIKNVSNVHAQISLNESVMIDDGLWRVGQKSAV